MLLCIKVSEAIEENDFALNSKDDGIFQNIGNFTLLKIKNKECHRCMHSLIGLCTQK